MVTYPNESPEYREAREALLKAELELRDSVERVAEMRRQLPPGGALKEDYTFTEQVDGSTTEVKFSELFGDHDTLFAYSFMYAPDMQAACPMCTALLDALNGQMDHLSQRISVVVIAKHDIGTIQAHAQSRGWDKLRLLSSADTTYNVDYLAEEDGEQTTNANVFLRTEDGIRHTWGAEVAFAPMNEGQNMRHVDMIWPLWNVLDMTPGGRGDWYPSLSYT